MYIIFIILGFAGAQMIVVGLLDLQLDYACQGNWLFINFSSYHQECICHIFSVPTNFLQTFVIYAIYILL